MKVQIPTSIEDAINNLNGIDALMTAKGWERAALVAAFCEKAKPGPAGVTPDTQRISITDFAALGINGLGYRNTVAMYLQAWAETGLPTPVPGKQCELPTSKWPPTGSINSTNTRTKIVDRMASDPDYIASVLADVVVKGGSDGIVNAIIEAKLGEDVEGQLIDDRVRNAISDRGEAIKDKFEDLTTEATENFDHADVGSKNSDAADVIRMARNLLLIRTMNPKPAADLINAYKLLESAASHIVQEATNTGPIQWSDNDKAFAGEMGIELEVG